jgi:hypothetical protein
MVRLIKSLIKIWSALMSSTTQYVAVKTCCIISIPIHQSIITEEKPFCLFFLKIFNLHNYYIYRYSFCYQLITIFLHSNFSDNFDIIYLNIQLLRVEKYRNSLVVEGDSISPMTGTQDTGRRPTKQGAIKNGQSRDTGNIWYTRHRTKTNKTKNTTQKIRKWAHFLLLLECITSWLHFHDIFLITRNSLVVEGDSISAMTKTLKLFLSCKFPSLLFV